MIYPLSMEYRKPVSFGINMWRYSLIFLINMKNIPHRKCLKPFIGKRITCFGIVDGFGMVKLRTGTLKLSVEAVLFRNVYEQHNQFLLDHVWIPKAGVFNEMDLKTGDLVKFRAEVIQYRKGKEYQIVDYTFEIPVFAEKVKYITND